MHPHPLRTLPASALCLVLLTTVVSGVKAQPAELRTRMDRLVAAVRDEAPLEEIAGFFPRQIMWEMVQTPRADSPRGPGGLHRFAPEHTLAAIREGGPVCESIGGITGHYRSFEGTLVRQAQRHERQWRHVGGRRFVPPGRGPRSPVFVQWAEEDGRWVVARIGEEYHRVDEAWLAWRPPNAVTPDSSAAMGVPPERRFAMQETWYVNSDVIYFRRQRYIKFGLPRPLEDHQLEPVGWLDTAPVFVERGGRLRPLVLYVRAVPPRGYQPYQGHGGSVCRD